MSLYLTVSILSVLFLAGVGVGIAVAMLWNNLKMSEQVKRFYIAEECLTNISLNATVTVRDTQTDQPTPVVAHGIQDHPEFDRLRHQLEDQGYIRIEQSWWNGDRVLRGFYLNDCLFYQGEQFPCASAMKYLLKSKGTMNVSNSNSRQR